MYRLILGIGLAWSSAAGAVTVDHDDIRVMVEDLVPRIERTTGRTFDHKLVIELTDREQLTARRINLLFHEFAQVPGLDANERIAAATQMATIPRNMLGLYDHLDDTIYLLGDEVEMRFTGAEIPAELLPSFMTCLVAHELTHALQHQELGMATGDTEDALRLAQATREGHAELVMREVCLELGYEAAAGCLMGGSGADDLRERDPTDPHVFLYGFGTRYMDARWKTDGADGTWAAMADPPNTMGALLVTSGTNPLANDTQRTVIAIRALAPHSTEIQLQPATTLDVLSRAGVEGMSAVLDVITSFTAQATANSGNVMVHVSRYGDPARPAALVDAFQSGARRARRDANTEVRFFDAYGTEWVVSATEHVALLRFGVARRLSGVDHAAAMRTSWKVGPRQNAKIYEYWVAAGDQLAIAHLRDNDVAKRIVAEILAEVLGPLEAAEEPLPTRGAGGEAPSG
ncbi:MAG: hypothetical protein JRI25_23405 [Deltaproteobacteria bacterium]|nr:hypothetical protein [Deltaproteobacteria bacterium]